VAARRFHLYELGRILRAQLNCFSMLAISVLKNAETGVLEGDPGVKLGSWDSWIWCSRMRWRMAR
jgi:hypothetical protein